MSGVEEDPPPDDPKRRRQGSSAGTTKIMRDKDGNPIPIINESGNNTTDSSEQENSILNASNNNEENAASNNDENIENVKSNPFMQEQGKAMSDILNWYPQNHSGPFHVLVKPNEVLTKTQRNSELFLYEKIRHVIENKDFTIKNIGFNQYRITFKSAREANDFVLNPLLKELNLGVLIPDRFIQKYCIIRNVPLSFTYSDIISEIEDNNGLEVISVYRFNRRDAAGKFSPSLTIKIGIMSPDFPKEIKMFGSLVETEVYVPPLRQCKNCGRLGHIASRCKGKKRCLLCGRAIICDDDNCREQKCESCLVTTFCKDECVNPRCINCNASDHSAENSKVCPVWKKEVEIREVMTISNLSRKEVVNKYGLNTRNANNQNNNYFDILTDKDYEINFPSMERKSNVKVRNTDEEINRRITKLKYSSVAQPKLNPNIKQIQPVQIEPTKPVFQYPRYEKTSEFERFFNDFTNQLKSVLISSNCQDGLKLLEKFNFSCPLTSSDNLCPESAEIPKNLKDPTTSSSET